MQATNSGASFAGMLLLGTVEGCAGETVRLKLDIDRGRPEQPSCLWDWKPATGNLMYMMPRKGTRGLLYEGKAEAAGASGAAAAVGKVLVLGFGEGFLGSAASQKIILYNELAMVNTSFSHCLFNLLGISHERLKVQPA